MILIEKTNVVGIEDSIRGMRNPMNSWDKSDSGLCRGGDSGIGCQNSAAHDECWHTYDHSFQIGKKDHNLMMNLAQAGPVHGKYRRMIAVYVDITAPLYWWKEFDTYKVGTVANSCSTMHKIHAKEFTLEDFSHEHLFTPEDYTTYYGTEMRKKDTSLGVLMSIVGALNGFRKAFLDTNDKRFWWQMIQLLPSSYNQKRTVMLNYEVLSNIYQYRREHKLDEWRDFCLWIEQLPHSEIVVCNAIRED